MSLAMNRTLFRCCAAFLLIGFGLLWYRPAHAARVTCTASMTNVRFGTVDPLSSQTDINATLNYTCTNNTRRTRYVTACFSIDAGAQGGGKLDPRQMQDGAGNTLEFQLYQDPARTIIWGSQFSGVAPTPLKLELTVPGRGRGGAGSISGNSPLYGRVLGGQATAFPGSYGDVFGGAQTTMTLNVRNNAPPAPCANASAGGFTFAAQATVVPQCLVGASPLDFGNGVGLLTSAVNAAATLGVQCSNGTPYNVGLDGGQNSGGNVNARKMVLGAYGIAYQLYQNPARSTVWGSTIGTNTVAGTGNGSTQSLTVYGRVPVQATPTAGTYRDSIVVSVLY